MTDSIRVAAFDPGLTGAAVILCADQPGGTLVDYMLMPRDPLREKRIDIAAVKRWLDHHSPDYVAVEDVGGASYGKGKRKQGGVGMFNFGYNAAVPVVLAYGMGLDGERIELISPQAWKKLHRLIGAGKDGSRQLALQAYPHIKEFQLKGKGQALADALYIGKASMPIWSAT